MTTKQRQELDSAFEQIEATILPSISLMLDTLLDAASLARPGQDAEAYASDLRSLASQLDQLTRQVEAIAPYHMEFRHYPVASVA